MMRKKHTYNSKKTIFEGLMNTQLDASRIFVKRLHCRSRCASSRTEQMYVNIKMDKIGIEMNKRSAINGIQRV